MKPWPSLFISLRLYCTPCTIQWTKSIWDIRNHFKCVYIYGNGLSLGEKLFIQSLRLYEEGWGRKNWGWHCYLPILHTCIKITSYTCVKSLIKPLFLQTLCLDNNCKVTYKQREVHCLQQVLFHSDWTKCCFQQLPYQSENSQMSWISFWLVLKANNRGQRDALT